MRRTGFALAGVLIAGALGVAAAAQVEPGGSFIDDDGNVHEGYIEAIALEGITAGCDTGLYCPNDFVTRAQMATFLARALELDPVAGTRFSDVSGTHAQNINAIADAGITAGCDTGLYCPNDFVTRAQMATFLGRALELDPIDVPPRPLPVAGNPDGNAPIPAGAGEVDTASPDRLIGNGTPESCTSAAVVAAVAQGGIIRFDCGPDPVTIQMDDTALIYNDTGPEIVLDGLGLVTLDGMGERRILYMNTCDQDLVWTTSHCNDQDHPRLTVQNLTFVNGYSDDQVGGGAIHVQGGQFQAVNSRFFSNACAATGPDVGGAGVRLILTWTGAPNYIINSTFGGSTELANRCSNGGAVSGLHASITVLNSYFAYSEATGWGANPQRSGTPGGGNGGTIYGDGTDFEFRIAGTLIEHGTAPEGGGGIFYVSNDRSGHLIIEDSTIRTSPSGGFWTSPYESIFYLGNGPIQITNSDIQ
jgi:hypothetical protein